MQSSSFNERASTGSRRGVLIWLIVSQLLFLASLLPWFIFFAFSFMAIDAEVNAEGIALVAPIWLYPIVSFGAMIAAWLCFGRQRYRWLKHAAVGVRAAPDDLSLLGRLSHEPCRSALVAPVVDASSSDNEHSMRGRLSRFNLHQ